MRPTILAPVLLVACAKSGAPEAAPADDGTRSPPEPLAELPFTMPEIQRATLSNGLEVMLVRNDEVPLFDLRVVFAVGPADDPQGKEGLRSVTFDMLNEGADGMDAGALADATKKLGGYVDAGAGRDSAAVSVGGLSANLEPLLDVWADVLLRPDFPAAEWELMQQQRASRLEAELEDPVSVARRVARKVAYGGAYTGRLVRPDTYDAIGTDDLRAAHEAIVHPGRAVLLAGGDLELDTLVAALEARLGDWTAGEGAAAPPDATPLARTDETIYVVDEPGTAQSVIRASLPVTDRADVGWWDLYLANTAFGGAFTARVNMNLREDKGWTYGARCGLDDNPGPSLWICGTSVQADATVPALAELRTMVRDAVGDAPLTSDEIAYFQGYRINSFNTAYETPASLLGELQDIWTYDLPTDWLDQYVPRVRSVTPSAANQAFKRWVDPERVAWILVADLDAHREGLEALGLDIVELDVDGAPVEQP